MKFIKVTSESDLKENGWYKPKSSDNLYQIMFWTSNEITLWSNNNSNKTKRIKLQTFIKNWYKGI